MVSFNEFKAVNLRIGKIMEIQGDKIKIDTGNKNVFCQAKNIEAKPGELVVVVTKESEAMLLAVKDKNGKYSLIVPESETEPGTLVE